MFIVFMIIGGVLGHLFLFDEFTGAIIGALLGLLLAIMIKILSNDDGRRRSSNDFDFDLPDLDFD